MSKPLYIFDLDGTLALIDHRRHLVSEGRKDWDAFYKACVDDAPHKPVVTVFNTLLSLFFERGGSYHSVNDIWVVSGRSDVVLKETEDWLEAYTQARFRNLVPNTVLKMRTEGDYTPDDQLKEKWLNEMSPEDRARLVCVFDDRRKVVDMYRRNGVTCLQVAEGDF